MGLCLPSMNTPIRIYDFVMERLRAKDFKQRLVAKESGVPFSTVSKIAQGVVKHPSVHTIQKLYEYFDKKQAEERKVA